MGLGCRLSFMPATYRTLGLGCRRFVLFPPFHATTRPELGDEAQEGISGNLGALSDTLLFLLALSVWFSLIQEQGDALSNYGGLLIRGSHDAYGYVVTRKKGRQRC